MEKAPDYYEIVDEYMAQLKEPAQQSDESDYEYQVRLDAFYAEEAYGAQIYADSVRSEYTRGLWLEQQRSIS